MHPVLFEVGGIPVPTYGTILLLAFLAAIGMFAYLMRRHGAPFNRMVDLGFGVAISGEIGARITYVVVEWERFAAGSVSWVQFMTAGRVVLGGAVGALIGSFWLMRRAGREFGLTRSQFVDAGFVGGALGMAIGRVGCLMTGCCYGGHTDWGWGMVFTEELAHTIAGTPLGVALHPTQWLLIAQGTLVFLVCLWAIHRSRYAGVAAGLFWVVGGISRFGIEVLRADYRGAWWLGLSTSQWISLGGVLLGLLWLGVVLRRGNAPARRQALRAA